MQFVLAGRKHVVIRFRRSIRDRTLVSRAKAYRAVSFSGIERIPPPCLGAVDVEYPLEQIHVGPSKVLQFDSPACRRNSKEGGTVGNHPIRA